MFDAYEAVDNLINEINNDYAFEVYNEIYQELNDRVYNGEMTLEDAEIVNDLAYEKYFTEKGKNKKSDDDDDEENKQKREERKKTTKHILTGALVGASALALASHGSKKNGNNLKKTNNSLLSSNKTHAQNITKDIYVNKSFININQKKMNRNTVTKKTPVGNPKKISNNVDNQRIRKKELPTNEKKYKLTGPSKKTMTINGETYNVYEKPPVLMDKGTKQKIAQSKVLAPLMKIGQAEDRLVRGKNMKKKPISKRK